MSFSLTSAVAFGQPTGGVRQGQAIYIPHASNGDLSTTEVTPFMLNADAAVDSELGHWKDGLFDCWRWGFCHPSLLNAIFCPQILAAQVLTRLKMNLWGERAPDEEWKRTFIRMFGIVCFYWFATSILSPPRPVWLTDHGRPARLPVPSDTPSIQLALNNLLYWSMAIYTLIILTKLRRAVRQRYEIGQTYHFLGPWEDVCVSFWCGCCSVAQLARQSATYEQQPAACCSPTGLGYSSFSHPIISV